MSGVSSAELILLLLIGLVVLGPKRLPEIANKIGGWVGQARRMTRVMKRQLEDELSLDDSPDIKPPKTTPPFASASPNPADPAYDDDEAVDADAPHIPNDDDTYSALHDESDDEAERRPSDDEAEREQSA